MNPFRPLVALALLLWLAACGSPPNEGGSAAAAPSALVVNCYDENRRIVQQTLKGHCQGRIVSDDEAQDLNNQRSRRVNEVAATTEPAIVPGRTLTGVASGFFVTNDGIVLTNNHAIANCGAVSVANTEGNGVIAEVLHRDPQRDLALLRAPLRAPAVAMFAPGFRPMENEEVFAVGYPDQGVPPITPLLTRGQTVDAVAGVASPPGTLIFRADVRRGNSGGPLLSKWGSVIGVVFAKVDAVSLYRKTGEVVRDVGYAIPNQTVFGVLDAQKIAYQRTPESDRSPPGDLLAFIRPAMVRIGCWR